MLQGNSFTVGVKTAKTLQAITLQTLTTRIDRKPIATPWKAGAALNQ